jgi:hypothetical protein
MMLTAKSHAGNRKARGLRRIRSQRSTDLIFRRHDLSGFVTACWLVFVMVLPFVGVFVYLIADNERTGERNIEQAQA